MYAIDAHLSLPFSFYPAFSLCYSNCMRMGINNIRKMHPHVFCTDGCLIPCLTVMHALYQSSLLVSNRVISPFTIFNPSLHSRTCPHIPNDPFIFHHQASRSKHFLQCLQYPFERRLRSFFLCEARNGDIGAAPTVE